MTGLYSVTVPVLRHYLERLAHLIENAPEALWQSRLTEGGFTARGHAFAAQNFALGAVFPTLGRDLPALPDTAPGPAGLAARTAAIDQLLAQVSEAELDAAATREVRHEAGQGDIVLPGLAFLTRFALPNFFFHLTTAYSILRAGGAELGKVDFDGFHIYAPGFRF
ncbi:MAG: DUF1993 family protein [Paracoccaceae bacterium]|nr:DUF1993 family protein [Paracoccaceae bacterium]